VGRPWQRTTKLNAQFLPTPDERGRQLARHDARRHPVAMFLSAARTADADRMGLPRIPCRWPCYRCIPITPRLASFAPGPFQNRTIPVAKIGCGAISAEQVTHKIVIR
jgi:hypothetical protein